jgi:hypothetical protein
VPEVAFEIRMPAVRRAVQFTQSECRCCAKNEAFRPFQIASQNLVPGCISQVAIYDYRH